MSRKLYKNKKMTVEWIKNDNFIKRPSPYPPKNDLQYQVLDTPPLSSLSDNVILKKYMHSPP